MSIVFDKSTTVPGGTRKQARRVSAQRANAWGKATSTALEVLAEILRCAQDDRQGTKTPLMNQGECQNVVLPSLPSHAFFQADKTVVADDEVIDQFDIEDTACGDKLLRNRNILR